MALHEAVAKIRIAEVRALSLGMRNLKESLPALLLTSIAACKGAPTPTVGSGPTTPINGSTPTPVSDALRCEEIQKFDDFYAILPWTSQVDGIAFYSVAVSDDEVQTVGAGARLGYVHGTPGQDASASAARDRTAQTYFEGPAKGQGWVHTYAPQHRVAAYGFAVVSRGGTHEVVATIDALRRLLAPLTTASAAQAWSAIDEVGVGCRVDPKTPIVAGQGWFDLPTTFETCVPAAGATSATVTMLRLYRVFADGRIELQPPREISRRPTPEGCIMVGRRPVAMFDEQLPSTTFAGLLAETAQLEAAAVVAFAELAASLRAFGAPASLVARAEQAQQDEIRHAAIMQRHAVAYGAVVPSTPATCSPRGYANELALALHNAREGCVHETYGALVALHQAHFAAAPELRSDLQQIANDEVAHAQWSHDLDAWLTTRLSPAERAAVAAAKTAACKALLATVGGPTSAAQQQFGLPDHQVAAQLALGLHQQMIAMSGTAPSMS